ncbi:hypothetical protein [Pantoea anthophila]|uniref:hypothetical protein n=1 Tax=Pantoea anthophila TaxID=470931 RepID=UPI0030182021
MPSSETENRHRPNHINPPVFFISAGLIFVPVTFAAFFRSRLMCRLMLCKVRCVLTSADFNARFQDKKNRHKAVQRGIL